jgi:hypothetical protein
MQQLLWKEKTSTSLLGGGSGGSQPSRATAPPPSTASTLAAAGGRRRANLLQVRRDLRLEQRVGLGCRVPPAELDTEAATPGLWMVGRLGGQI